MNTGMEPSTPQDLSTWKHFVSKKAFLILRIGSVVLMGFYLKNAFGWPGNAIPHTFNIAYFARIHQMVIYIKITSRTVLTEMYASIMGSVIMSMPVEINEFSHL